MPSISNYLDATQILVDAIVDTADRRHCQQSCHMSATTLAINAILDIDRRHRQPSCRASAPAIDAIVDIDRGHQRQQSRRALSSAPAPAIDAIVDSVKKAATYMLPPSSLIAANRQFRSQK
jgi:hypothetical protein